MSSRGGGTVGDGGGLEVSSDGNKGVNEVGGVRNQLGLNPYRHRGFGDQYVTRRYETPSLNEMRAKQGALVSKFMTFFQRKCSLVIEMYAAPFYRRKPDWDRIAEFIYNDLCNTPELRKEVLDVQFHPVKMLLFIKCSDEQWRDAMVARVQSDEGVTWSEYGVRVKGYSLDAQVKFIRLLGVSPETEEEEIRATFQELGIGEVIESKKGMLDAKRLPWITNGTWALRVKILDPDKMIPSYIHRRDEGELWSLNFEGRVFCCWKCGSGTHIGDKCRDQSRTFEEIFNGSVTDTDFEKPTWAAVVRSGPGDGEGLEQRQRIKEIEAKLKEDNKRRDREEKLLEERRKIEEEEAENQKQAAGEERRRALEDVARKARELYAGKIVSESECCLDDDSDDSLLSKVADVAGQTVVSVDPEAEAGDKALLTAIKHRSWLESRSVRNIVESGVNINLSLRNALELERIFGPGAAEHQLAIEYQSKGINLPEDVGDKKFGEETGDNDVDESLSDDGVESDEVMQTSTPTREPRGIKRKRKQSGFDSSISLSPVRNIPSGSNADQSGSAGKKNGRFDKCVTVHEGEGDAVPHREGVTVCEGDTVHQGDGDAVHVGEREVVPRGEEGDQQMNNLSYEWASICEFWEEQDSLNSESSHEGNVQSGDSDRGEGKVE